MFKQYTTNMYTYRDYRYHMISLIIHQHPQSRVSVWLPNETVGGWVGPFWSILAGKKIARVQLKRKGYTDPLPSYEIPTGSHRSAAKFWWAAQKTVFSWQRSNGHIACPSVQSLLPPRVGQRHDVVLSYSINEDISKSTYIYICIMFVIRNDSVSQWLASKQIVANLFNCIQYVNILTQHVQYSTFCYSLGSASYPQIFSSTSTAAADKAGHTGQAGKAATSCWDQRMTALADLNCELIWCSQGFPLFSTKSFTTQHFSLSLEAVFSPANFFAKKRLLEALIAAQIQLTADCMFHWPIIELHEPWLCHWTREVPNLTGFEIAVQQESVHCLMRTFVFF